MNRRDFLGASLALTLPFSSHAQAYPTKPIRYIVPVAAGGGNDMIARVVTERWGRLLGQTFVVENQSGGGGVIASQNTMRAAPDGYTFLIAPTSVETANPSLFKSTLLPSRDLTPVAGIGRTQMYLVAKPQMPAKDVKDLVALAKAQPGKMSYASAGAGTPPHLACELFKQATHTPDITHIPYRGAAPALQDVLSGQADFVCDPGIAFPHIKTGKVKLLGIVSAKRSPFFPDVPTVAEQGFKGADLDIWFGMWAPNNTPADVLARMNKEIGKALAQTNVKARYGDLGAETTWLETAEFKTLLTTEGRVLSSLIREQKISVD